MRVLAKVLVWTVAIGTVPLWLPVATIYAQTTETFVAKDAGEAAVAGFGQVAELLFSVLPLGFILGWVYAVWGW